MTSLKSLETPESLESKIIIPVPTPQQIAADEAMIDKYYNLKFNEFKPKLNGGIAGFIILAAVVAIYFFITAVNTRHKNGTTFLYSFLIFCGLLSFLGIFIGGFILMYTLNRKDKKQKQDKFKETNNFSEIKSRIEVHGNLYFYHRHRYFFK